MASRSELYSKIGYTKPVVEPILNVAYEIEEEQTYREDLFSSPHGKHWHTSFHVSSFPGDDPKACPRKALYSMMNIPGPGPINRAGRAVMEAGLDIEDRIVWRFHRAGVLLSDPPDSEHQMGYVDKEHWLTGNPDAIILRPKKNQSHVVEIKSKDHAVIEAMKEGRRSWDEPHRRQILPYISLTHENADRWPDVNPATQGSILYVSRDRPHFTHEFRFNKSDAFMEEGRDKLKLWKQSFLDEELPERPKDWKWTESPCQYCPFKKFACKPDVKDKITKLSESNGIEFAKSVRKDYSYEKTRKAVLDRWKNKGGDA